MAQEDGVSLMTILFKLDGQGGFTCGDNETGKTAYAYPTSPYAENAKRDPMSVAQSLLNDESWRKPCGPKWVREYDTNNWLKLKEEFDLDM
jgi:hypothetical protein